MPIDKTDSFYQVFVDNKNAEKKELTKKIAALTSRLKVETEKNNQMHQVDTTNDESILNKWTTDRDTALHEHQKKILNQEVMIDAMEETYERERVRIQRQIDALALKLTESKAIHDGKVASIRKQVNMTKDNMEKSLSFFESRIKGAQERIDQAISSKNPVIIKMGLELKELEEQLAKTNRILSGV